MMNGNFTFRSQANPEYLCEVFHRFVVHGLAPSDTAKVAGENFGLSYSLDLDE